MSKKYITHYDANDNHIDFMDGVLDPGDTDKEGNQYHDIEAYEAELERQSVLATNQHTYTGSDKTSQELSTSI